MLPSTLESFAPFLIALSLVLSVIWPLEFLAMWLFWPRLFSVGIKVFSEEIHLERPAMRLSQGARGETPSGKYCVGPEGEILFRAKMLIFPSRSNTPFPVKGIARTDGERILVNLRLPLGAVFFLVVFATIAFLMLVLSLGNLPSLLPTLLISGFLAAFFVNSVFIEIRKARSVLEELVQSSVWRV